jgi:Ca2+-binding EF-hand superfamily protein
MVNTVSGSSFAGYQNFSASSVAQRHKEMFQQLDADGDGKITESELKAGRLGNGRGPDVKEVMKQADTNGDGAIDKSENETFLSKMDAQRPSGPPPGPPRSGKGGKEGSDSSSVSSSTIFDELDTNKDGKVSLQELMAAKPDDASETDTVNLMKEIDTNGDGLIDKNENATFMAKMKEMRELLNQQTQIYNRQGQRQVQYAGTVVNASA